MKPLRLAVIGAGHLGRIHARIAAGLPEFELVAIADPVAECRENVVAEAKTQAVADYRELIGEIDAAVVGPPTNTHHTVGIELLSSGIPLLVEKPLAPNSAAADELVSLARKQGLVLQVGHVERFNPALAWAMSEVRDPKYIQATRTSGYSFRSTDIGVVLDMMIHDLDIVLALANSTVCDVQALGISVLGGHEDMVSARIEFGSGCVAELTASRVSPEQRRTMNIFTSRCAATIDFATQQASLVKPREDVLRRQFDVNQLTHEERNELKSQLFDEVLIRTEHTASKVNAIEEEQRDFAASIRTGKSPRVDGMAARQAIVVAEMILAGVDEHAWDGSASGRHGPFAMPALPILPGPAQWQDDARPHRRAG